jgi:hypothetical protein
MTRQGINDVVGELMWGNGTEKAAMIFRRRSAAFCLESPALKARGLDARVEHKFEPEA